MVTLKRLTENKLNLSYTYSEKSDNTGVSIERWSEENEEYYDSDKIEHRLLVTVNLEGKPVGSAILVYNTYLDENGDDTIIDDNNSNDEGYLERIDVDDEYQGKGIGTQLLKTCIEKLKSLGLSPTVVLAPDNNRAKQWYEKIGTEIYDNDWYGVDQGYGVYRIRLFDLG